MKPALRKLYQKLQQSLGIEVTRRISKLDKNWSTLVETKGYIPPNNPEGEFIQFCKLNFHRSRAQLFQDLFVLHELEHKRGGYFVEFGATDGVTLSNTLLLEAEYGWRGLLAEPARAWHERLRVNRAAIIDTRCVTGSTGEIVVFNETEWLEVSTIDKWSASDHHADLRVGGKRYNVETISLNDLLNNNNAPNEIDYLSVDTEGSEFEILNAFDFEQHRPKVITVEHNFTKMRTPIHDLLVRNGYRRKFERLSNFDDWYVLDSHKSLI